MVKVDTYSLERRPLPNANGRTLSRAGGRPWGRDTLRDGRQTVGVCLPWGCDTLRDGRPIAGVCFLAQ